MENSQPTPLKLEPDDFNVDYTEEDFAALPPEEPSLAPAEWIKKNLFSSVGSAILTFVFGLFALWALRGLFGFTFSNERRWDAVATNARLIAVERYPLDQFNRIWVSLGSLLALTGLSMAFFRASGHFTVKRISMWLMNLGVLGLLGVVLTPGATTEVPAEVEGELPTFIQDSFSEAIGGRVVWIVVSLVTLGIGLAIWYGLGEDRRRTMRVASRWVITAGFGLAVLSLWVVPYGQYFLEDGVATSAPGLVASSTRIPWTLMWVVFAGALVLGLALRDRLPVRPPKMILGLLWLLAPFILNWIVLRDPDFDYAHVFSTDIPMALAFMALGGALLFWLSSATIGETGKIVSVVLLAFSLFNWIAGFFGMYPMLQKARFSFLFLGLFALIAGNFSRDRSTRMSFVYAWMGFMAIFHWLVTAVNSPSTLEITSDTYLGGMTLTIFVAWLTLLVSFPLGVLMALARTSNMPIFRLLSTTYIEAVRGVPLITILFFFSVIIPLFLPEGMELAELAAVVVGYGLFSAAYLAENVRGGLQSIRRGQFEAADALGLTTGQRTSFIVLPQALRVSIPPLVGQSIATFKETSLLAIIGLNDLLRVANNTIPSQTDFVGSKKEGLLVVSALYFVVAFSMSKYSQRLEKRLGLGTR
jgi:general L-amino acid transport system permease protein